MQKVADYTVNALHAMRHVNRPITEHFITKVIWEMANCNIKNSGELDSDK